MKNSLKPRALSSWISTDACGRILGASIILFVASLTQDGYYIAADNPRAWAPSFGLLLIGWIGVLQGIPAWLANPMLAAAWASIYFRSKGLVKLGLVCGVASLCFSLSFLKVDEIIANEAGGTSRITGYGPGYWLWIASIVTAIIGCIAGMRASPSST